LQAVPNAVRYACRAGCQWQAAGLAIRFSNVDGLELLATRQIGLL
jgi:hypothetical protein